MKQRELEMLLERVPPHPEPSAALEQYATPAPIAADLVYRALAARDIAGQRVLDLGCGTGVLAIGAALAGAAEAVGLDLDVRALALAEQAARALGLPPGLPAWRLGKVEDLHEACDTVLMNPPFGAQRRHADRPFHAAALRCGRVVYTLCNADTLEWVAALYEEGGARVTARWRYRFPLPASFPWHEKPRAHIEVAALRAERGS